MSEEKIKKGYHLGIPPIQRGYFDHIWENTANPAECCRQVAEGICQYWTPPTDPIAKGDIDGLFIGPKGDAHFVSVKSQLVDYLRGAGSAMNPMPNEGVCFYTSDSEAMASDWNATMSDMYVVLRVNDLFSSKHGQRKHEQPIGRDEPGVQSGRLERSRFK